MSPIHFKLRLVSIHRLLILFSPLFFLVGCSNQKPLAKVQQSPQMPNIYFEQATKGDIASNNALQPRSQNQTNAEVEPTLLILPKKQNTIQYQRNTNPQVAKVTSNHCRVDNKIKVPKSQTAKPIPGLGRSIFGLIINATVFGVGIWWAIDFGLSWGGGVGIIWFLYLLLGIPAVILGTSLTLSGLRKLLEDERFREWLSIPILSLLAFLGTAVIIYLSVTA